MVIAICNLCGKQFNTSYSHYIKKEKHFCSQNCYSEYQRNYPSNTGKTRFKKGHKPWNRNKLLTENPKQRRVPYYRKITLEERPACNRCNKEAKLVHHKDGDFHNNNLDNLEPMCYSCHAKEHKLERNLPQDGGWSVRRR